MEEQKPVEQNPLKPSQLKEIRQAFAGLYQRILALESAMNAQGAALEKHKDVISAVVIAANRMVHGTFDESDLDNLRKSARNLN